MAPYPYPGHHCATCKKAFSQSCIKKGHMVQCPKCGSWIMPGKSCATCAAKAAAEERKRKEAEEAKKKGESSKKKGKKRSLARRS